MSNGGQYPLWADRTCVAPRPMAPERMPQRNEPQVRDALRVRCPSLSGRGCRGMGRPPIWHSTHVAHHELKLTLGTCCLSFGIGLSKNFSGATPVSLDGMTAFPRRPQKGPTRTTPASRSGWQTAAHSLFSRTAIRCAEGFIETLDQNAYVERLG